MERVNGLKENDKEWKTRGRGSEMKIIFFNLKREKQKNHVLDMDINVRTRKLNENNGCF